LTRFSAEEQVVDEGATRRRGAITTCKTAWVGAGLIIWYRYPASLASFGHPVL
jgi:hypothetical protein